MNIKQPDSLYQSMGKWLGAYEKIHGCSEDEAFDAFETWREAEVAAGRGMDGASFHENVKAATNEMVSALGYKGDRGELGDRDTVVGEVKNAQYARSKPTSAGGEYPGQWRGRVIEPTVKVFTDKPVEIPTEVVDLALTRLEIEEQIKMFKGFRAQQSNSAPNYNLTEPVMWPGDTFISTLVSHEANRVIHRAKTSDNKVALYYYTHRGNFLHRTLVNVSPESNAFEKGLDLEERIVILEARLEMICALQERNKKRTGRTLTLHRPGL